MSENEVTSYARVSGNETEIGVIGGGTMMVETASGEMAVTPGNAVTIAPIGTATSASVYGEGEESTLVTDIALGVAGVAVLATGVYLLSTFDGNRSNKKSDGSPSSP